MTKDSMKGRMRHHVPCLQNFVQIPLVICFTCGVMFSLICFDLIVCFLLHLFRFYHYRFIPVYRKYYSDVVFGERIHAEVYNSCLQVLINTHQLSIHISIGVSIRYGC